MVDELTQESFQTGKAIVTVSVDLITAIADACKRSEQQNPGMSEEQKETLLGKVVDKVMSNYKETHGSLMGFNREGKDVTHIDVNDERTAELLEKACKKSHIPVDMKKVTRADGSITHTAFCEVKSIDQMGFNNFGDAHIARQIMAIRNTFNLNSEFLSYCICFYINSIKASAKGIIPGISREDILNLILPIPPSEYQEQVVAYIRKVNVLFDSLEKSLN